MQSWEDLFLYDAFKNGPYDYLYVGVDNLRSLGRVMLASRALAGWGLEEVLEWTEITTSVFPGPLVSIATAEIANVFTHLGPLYERWLLEWSYQEWVQCWVEAKAQLDIAEVVRSYNDDVDSWYSDSD